MVFRPPPKVGQLMRSVKDQLGLVVPGVYWIPFSYAQWYIGETECSIILGCIEYLRLGQGDPNGWLANPGWKMVHQILFSSTVGLLFIYLFRSSF